MRPALVAAMRRLDISAAEVVAVGLLCLGALVAFAMLWLLSRPAGQASAVQAPPLTVTGAAEGAPTEAPTELVVHVAGLVRRPGLVRLAPGSRVADALEAAGGPRRKATLDSLNLARLLVDGEQLLVTDQALPPATTLPAGGTAPPAGSAITGALISLNSADIAQLEELPGVGPVLAQRIVEHRDSIGGFTEIGQLRDVSGIGEKTFQSLAPLVSL